MQLRVAVAQMPVSLSIYQNLEAVKKAIAFARQHKTHILLTPEGSLSGYTQAELDRSELESALGEIVTLARKARIGLALGTCFTEADDGLCYNQIRFYDRDGQFLGFHSKQLRCGSMDDNPRGEITQFAARPLRTFKFHGLTIGGLICNDLWANPCCTPMPDPHLDP